MFSLKSVAIIGLLFAATACTPLSQQRPSSTNSELLWQERHQALVELDQWQISGRTLIRQGKEAWNAGLRWQQNRGVYQIKLEGPFSQGGVTLDGSETQAILTMNDGQKLVSADPETLIAQTLGVQLPVNALRDWVRGIPSSQKIDVLTLDDKGQITHLIQQGWDISFLKYMPFGNYSMPAKIYINHQDSSLRLAITTWNKI